MRQNIIITAVGFALAAGICQAQVIPNIDEGSKELRIAGSYDGQDPLDYQLNLEAGYGVFVRDNIEVGGLVGLGFNDLYNSLELGVFAEYNWLMDSAWVPFVQVAALYAAEEFDDDVFNKGSQPDEDAFVGRLGGGVKYFLTENVALAMSIEYDIASTDLYPDDDGNIDDYQYTAQMGLRFYWD